MRKKWPHFHNLTLPLDIPYLVVAIDRPKVHNSAIIADNLKAEKV